jgi:hypothetical protein
MAKKRANKRRRKRAQDNHYTLSVPEAGRKYFSLGRNASYTAAANGQIPVIKFGKHMRVPVATLERMVGRGE